MEKALADGKAKMIGVSNYPAPMIHEMTTYANVMPAVNQLEFHPRFASPAVLEACKEHGIVCTAYGTVTSTLIDKSPVVANIGKKMGLTPVQTVIRWTVQKGVMAIPRSKDPAHQLENLKALEGPDISPEDMAAIDALHENHPYYWLPEATLQTCKFQK